MNQAAFFLLCAFIFVLPWDVLTSVPMLGSIPRLIGLIASAVGVLRILASRRFRPLASFHVCAILFVLWAGITSFWSIDPDATRTRVGTYVQLALLVWLIWEIAWAPEHRRALLQAYVLGAAVAAVATIYNYLSGARVDLEAGRFTALNSDPNELGLTLVLGIPMAWYLSLVLPNRRWAWAWRLYLPLAITGTLLTASRGATLTGCIALCIIPLTLRRLRPAAKTALVALAIGTFALGYALIPTESLLRIGNTRSDIEAGYFGGRAPIWRAGFDLVQERPLTGVGAGAFPTAVEPTIHKLKSSHQVLLAILVEDGLVGLVLFLAMVVTAMAPIVRLPSLERRFWLILMAALIAGSISLAWDYRKQFWFVLGVLAAEGIRLRRKPSTLADHTQIVRPEQRQAVQ